MTYLLNQLYFCSACSPVFSSDFTFHCKPQVFYRIVVRRVVRPFHYFHFHLYEMLCNQLGLMTWGRVVLKNGLRMAVRRFSGDSPFYYLLSIIPSISSRALVPIEGMMNIKNYLTKTKSRGCKESANFHPQAIFRHNSAPRHKAKLITQ